MAEKRKPRSEMTHAEKIADHYRVIGRPNPFAFAHQGTPEQRKGGLGSNKGAARYESTSAEDRKKANSDGRFGYFDETNKRYVPAFIDAMDGGGRDTRGDTFEGGPLSEILNNIGVKPYGSQRERAFGGPTTSPIQQAVAGGPVRPRIRPASVEQAAANQAAMANQEASFTQPGDPLEPFGGLGPNITGAAAERGMGLDPFGGPGPATDYPNMNMPANAAYLPPPVSTYGGDIDPTQDGRIQAQRNIDNRERMRQAMSQVTQAEYDAMSRGQRADMGLPVRGIDLLFAGSDAFKQSVPLDRFGRSTGDAGFDEFMDLVRRTPGQGALLNDPAAAYDMYQRMKAAGQL